MSEVRESDIKIMQAASHLQGKNMRATPTPCGGSSAIRCCIKPLQQLHPPRLPPRHKVHDLGMHESMTCTTSSAWWIEGVTYDMLNDFWMLPRSLIVRPTVWCSAHLPCAGSSSDRGTAVEHQQSVRNPAGR